MYTTKYGTQLKEKLFFDAYLNFMLIYYYYKESS